MNENKHKDLLVRILRDLSSAATGLELDDDTCCETWYAPEFRWMPTVSLTEDDRKLIRELAEEEGDDFSTLTELVNG